MKPNNDPRVIFEQISTIENRYTTATQRIDKEDLIAVVLDAASKDYKAILTCEQRMMGTAVTLQDLETAMNQHYRQIKGSKPSAETDKEISLSAFGGVCYECKQAGHRAKFSLRRKEKATTVIQESFRKSAPCVVELATKRNNVGRRPKTPARGRNG